MMSCLRLFTLSAQCAIVTVTPEESSSSVLIAGTPHAAIGVKGSAYPGPPEGPCEVKPGHISAFCSMVARSGTETSRSQNNAPKNAPKKITSAKIYQPRPTREEASTHRPH